MNESDRGAGPNYGVSLFWPPTMVLVVILVASELLSTRYRVLSTLGVAIVVVIGAALAITTLVTGSRSDFDRAVLSTRLLVALVTLIEVVGVLHLIALIDSGRADIHGGPLLASGAFYWAMNVLAFGLWYWLLDRGGPHMRARGAVGRAEFLFPEMQAGEYADPRWSPDLTEYLYLAFTGATAFSPTDSSPLSSRMRILMATEAIVSMVILVLVTARAVNILR